MKCKDGNLRGDEKLVDAFSVLHEEHGKVVTASVDIRGKYVSIKQIYLII